MLFLLNSTGPQESCSRLKIVFIGLFLLFSSLFNWVAERHCFSLFVVLYTFLEAPIVLCVPFRRWCFLILFALYLYVYCRIGQRNSVSVRYLLAENTIDDKIWFVYSFSFVPILIRWVVMNLFFLLIFFSFFLFVSLLQGKNVIFFFPLQITLFFLPLSSRFLF